MLSRAEKITMKLCMHAFSAAHAVVTKIGSQTSATKIKHHNHPISYFLDIILSEKTAFHFVLPGRGISLN